MATVAPKRKEGEERKKRALEATLPDIGAPPTYPHLNHQKGEGEENFFVAVVVCM